MSAAPLWTPFYIRRQGTFEILLAVNTLRPGWSHREGCGGGLILVQVSRVWTADEGLKSKKKTCQLTQASRPQLIGSNARLGSRYANF